NSSAPTTGTAPRPWTSAPKVAATSAPKLLQLPEVRIMPNEAALVPLDQVVAAVRHATGWTPTELTLLQSKAPRDVYAAGDGSQRVVVKLEVPNKEGDYAVALEAWAMQQARDAGLPVPE